MFDDAGDSGEEEVDKDDDFPRHVSSRSSKRPKSGQVSFVYILIMLYSFFSLSALANAMLHGMLRYKLPFP